MLKFLHPRRCPLRRRARLPLAEGHARRGGAHPRRHRLCGRPHHCGRSASSALVVAALVLVWFVARDPARAAGASRAAGAGAIVERGRARHQPGADRGRGGRRAGRRARRARGVAAHAGPAADAAPAGADGAAEGRPRRRAARLPGNDGGSRRPASPGLRGLYIEAEREGELRGGAPDRRAGARGIAGRALGGARAAAPPDGGRRLGRSAEDAFGRRRRAHPRQAHGAAAARRHPHRQGAGQGGRRARPRPPCGAWRRTSWRPTSCRPPWWPGGCSSRQGDIRRATRILEATWKAAPASRDRRRLHARPRRRFGERPAEARRNALPHAPARRRGAARRGPRGDRRARFARAREVLDAGADDAPDAERADAHGGAGGGGDRRPRPRPRMAGARRARAARSGMDGRRRDPGEMGAGLARSRAGSTRSNGRCRWPSSRRRASRSTRRSWSRPRRLPRPQPPPPPEPDPEPPRRVEERQLALVQPVPPAAPLPGAAAPPVPPLPPLAAAPPPTRPTPAPEPHPIGAGSEKRTRRDHPAAARRSAGRLRPAAPRIREAAPPRRSGHRGGDEPEPRPAASRFSSELIRAASRPRCRDVPWPASPARLALAGPPPNLYGAPDAALAQSVEHRIRNARVAGSKSGMRHHYLAQFRAAKMAAGVTCRVTELTARDGRADAGNAATR